MVAPFEKQTATCGPALIKILNKCPEAIEQSNGWWSNPNNPTFDFRENEDGHISIHLWTGRTQQEILAMIGLQVADIYPRGYKTVHVRAKIDVLELAHAKCIPWQFLHNLGLQSDYQYKGRKCVKIPYFNADGTQHTKIKVRKAIEGDYKHCWDNDTPGEAIPYGLHKLDMARAAGYTLMGEGESDGWACLFNEVPYLGIPGADMQKTLKHLDTSLLPAKIYILLEPDQKQKLLDNGQSFYKSIHQALRNGGYTGEIFCIDFQKATNHKDPSALHIALWKEGKHGQFKDRIHQAMEQAIPANDTDLEDQQVDTTAIDKIIEGKDFDALLNPDAIIALAQLNRAEYARYKDRIREVFGKRVNMSDLNAAVTEARNLLKGTNIEETPSLDIIADDFAVSHKEDWAYNPLSSAWSQWTGTHWQNMQDSEAQKKSCVTLDRIVRDLMRERGLGINKSSDLDCVVRLAAIHCKRDFIPASGVVNFRNGTLEVSTGTLRSHDRNDQLTYCLPYDFDAHGRWPVICSFLQSLFPDKYARQNFMVHIGLSLMADTKMHYAGAIIGPPRVGKSTGLNLANLTCGISEGEYAGKTLFNPDLEGKRARYMQNKKRIVCIDELPAETLRNEETVKNMMAHSGVEMRGLMRDETLDNRWKPKIFMAMNEKPEYKDTSSAIKERIVPLMVSGTRPKDQRDLDLIDKMKPEVGGFAASCIRLAHSALKRGYYPLSGAMKQVLNEMETSNNPLKSFIQADCILDPSGFIFTDELYELYKAYCTPAGNKPLGKSKMSKELCEMGKGIKQKSRRNPFAENAVQRGLEGIRLRKPSDPELEEESAENGDPMLNVDDVDDMLTTLFERRQHDKTASEEASSPFVDDVDDTLEKQRVRDFAKNENSPEGTTATEENLHKSNNGKTSSTSSTNAADQPQKGNENVDDTQNTSSTCRQHRQQKSSFPSWLIPGTSEWNNLVERVGLKEANDRRQSALQEERKAGS